MPRIYNKHRDEVPIDAVYCMRPSKWGNPFVIGVDGNRDDVCDKYEAWLPTQPHLMADLHELTGRDLVCCCEPLRCHCRTLLRLANMSKKRLLLIDASNITHRAWHAVPTTLTLPNGEPINALYGFTKIVMSVLDRLKPDYVCVVLDSDTKRGWRRKIDPDYKNRRGDHDDALLGQFRFIPTAIRALNLKSDQRVGYEADDLIAAYCHRHRNDDLEIMIVSGDKDFMQLFTQPNVVLYDDMKKREFRGDDTRDKFFVPPEQVTMVQAIAGDKIDDISNLKGFGYKTAAQFIGEHTSFKSLFAALKTLRKADEAIKAKSKKQFKAKHALLLAERKRVLINMKLVTLAKDAPLTHELAALRHKPPKPKRFTRFLKRFNFNSLLGHSGVRVEFSKARPKKTPAKPKAPPPSGETLWQMADRQKKRKS